MLTWPDPTSGRPDRVQPHRWARVLLCLGALACEPEARPIELRGGSVGPSTVSSGDLGVAAFSRALVDADRRALAAGGAGPIAPVPGGWLVRDAARAATAPGVRWAGSVPPEARVDPALVAAAGRVVAVAGLLSDADPAAIAGRLREAGLPADGVGARRIVSALDPDQVPVWIETLLAEPDVLWLGRRGRRVLQNDESVWVGQSGLGGGGATPMFAAGITGAGQVGGLLDTGIDADGCWFDDGLGPPTSNLGAGTAIDSTRRKILAVDFLWATDSPADPTDWDDDGHGTHVAGTMAGDGGIWGVHDGYDGMAPGAKLVVQDGGSTVDDCADLPALGCPVVDLVPLFEQAWAQGVRVHNDSWGDQENAMVTNVYTDGSEDADAVTWDHPDLLLVFAAGNSGGTHQVFSPGNAKNTLSVGATQPGALADAMAFFSSGGPTADGRTKPDLVFPGQSIDSAGSDGDVTSGNCDVVALSGTSMASPGVAGLALLVRQYFADGWYPSGAPAAANGFNPTSALVKAALIASAQPVLVATEFSGWGRPQLDVVLPLAADAPRALLALDEGEGFVGGEDPVVVSIDVTSGAESLRIALVWRDPPSTPLAARNLVNDIDLVVRAPDGGVLLGNALDGFWSADHGKPDHVNNVEVVRLASPEVGRWQIEIAPFQVALGPQPWALVASGAFEAAPAASDEPGPEEPGPDTVDIAVPDAGPPLDVASPRDGAIDEETAGTGGTTGCGCSTAGRPTWLAALAALLVWRRLGASLRRPRRQP
jgi:subtilisin family serine protease